MKKTIFILVKLIYSKYDREEVAFTVFWFNKPTIEQICGLFFTKAYLNLQDSSKRELNNIMDGSVGSIACYDYKLIEVNENE